MSPSDHSHDLESLDRRSGRLHGLEASRWTDHLLERAMVRFDDVVEVLRCPMPYAGGEPAVTFQPFNCFRVRAELVGGDGGRKPVPHRCQGFAEESVGRTRASAFEEHEVDQHAVLVDSSEQILQSTTNLDVRFVHSPRR